MLEGFEGGLVSAHVEVQVRSHINEERRLLPCASRLSRMKEAVQHFRKSNATLAANDTIVDLAVDDFEGQSARVTKHDTVQELGKYGRVHGCIDCRAEMKDHPPRCRQRKTKSFPCDLDFSSVSCAMTLLLALHVLRKSVRGLVEDNIAHRQTSMQDVCSAAVCEFCRTREVLRNTTSQKRNDVLEHRDAERTFGVMLAEAMTKHNVPIVALEPRGDRQAEYLKFCPPAKRSMKITCDEDVLSLMQGIGDHVVSVPPDMVSKTVVDVVRRRAQERGPPPPPARVKVTQSIGDAACTEEALLPLDVRNLTSQYMQALEDLRKHRDEMRPLRVAHKQAEQTLLPLLPSQGVTVRIAAQGHRTRAVRLVRSSDAETIHPSPSAAEGTDTARKGQGESAEPAAPCEATSDLDPGSAKQHSEQGSVKEPAAIQHHTAPCGPTALGIREVVRIVRSAVSETKHLRFEKNYDVLLQSCVKKRLEERRSSTTQPVRPPKDRVRAMRAPLASATTRRASASDAVNE